MSFSPSQYKLALASLVASIVVLCLVVLKTDVINISNSFIMSGIFDTENRQNISGVHLMKHRQNISGVHLMKHLQNISGVHLVKHRQNFTILLWTKWFGDAKWQQSSLGTGPFQDCKYKKCHLTNDKSALSKADIVLSHCRDAVTYWPNLRKGQIHAVDCLESPINSGGFPSFKYKVNMTITYRKDSDIYRPYGLTKNRTAPLPGPYVTRVPFGDKTKSVVWPVSHCKTQSRRESYVKELSKFIDVDIIGACGKRTCSYQKQRQCMKQFEKSYKFYVSFENSVCVDYITEKAFIPLQHELIPIVFGGADYKTDLPPNSYIDIRDFKSPENLAAFLHKLSKNETEYNKFFQWKQRRTVHTYPTNRFCDMCNLLHSGEFHRSASTFDVDAWYRSGACHNNEIVKYL